MTKYIKTIFFFAIVFMSSCYNLQKVSDNNANENTIYLVRHAEKADDGTKDPPLTKEGEARAQYLAEFLKDKKIQKIYSTDYKRTRNTAAPLSLMLGIETTIYSPRDTSFYNVLRTESQTMNIYVVGHSNSTPSLTNAVIGEEKFKQLDESVYDQLFTVKAKGGKLLGNVEGMGEVK